MSQSQTIPDQVPSLCSYLLYCQRMNLARIEVIMLSGIDLTSVARLVTLNNDIANWSITTPSFWNPFLCLDVTTLGFFSLDQSMIGKQPRQFKLSYPFHHTVDLTHDMPTANEAMLIANDKKNFIVAFTYCYKKCYYPRGMDNSTL